MQGSTLRIHKIGFQGSESKIILKIKPRFNDTQVETIYSSIVKIRLFKKTLLTGAALGKQKKLLLDYIICLRAWFSYIDNLIADRTSVVTDY